MVPVWLAIVVGVLGGLGTIAGLFQFARSVVRDVVSFELNRNDGPVHKLISMEEAQHRLEQHVFNGLTEEVNRTGQQVTDIRVMVAEINAKVDDLC